MQTKERHHGALVRLDDTVAIPSRDPSSPSAESPGFSASGQSDESLVTVSIVQTDGTTYSAGSVIPSNGSWSMMIPSSGGGGSGGGGGVGITPISPTQSNPNVLQARFYEDQAGTMLHSIRYGFFYYSPLPLKG
jgi:hypothetical protein